MGAITRTFRKSLRVSAYRLKNLEALRTTTRKIIITPKKVSPRSSSSRRPQSSSRAARSEANLPSNSATSSIPASNSAANSNKCNSPPNYPKYPVAPGKVSKKWMVMTLMEVVSTATVDNLKSVDSTNHQASSLCMINQRTTWVETRSKSPRNARARTLRSGEIAPFITQAIKMSMLMRFKL